MVHIEPNQIWQHNTTRPDGRELRILAVTADDVVVMLYNPATDILARKTLPRYVFGPHRCPRKGHNRRARYRLKHEAPAQEGAA